MRKEAEDSERALKERLQRSESLRLEIEDELSRHKINAANERMLTDEQMASAKQRIRTEEVCSDSCFHHLTLFYVHFAHGCFETYPGINGAPYIFYYTYLFNCTTLT